MDLKVYCKQHELELISVWVKGINGVGEEEDYLGILKEILELEYYGYPIKKVVLFLCDLFDPTPIRRTRIVHLEYKLVEVRQRERYRKKIRDKIKWWSVIKTKARCRVKIEEMQEVACQNNISPPVDTVMPDELYENLLDHSHPIQNVNKSNLLRNDGATSNDVEDEVEPDKDKEEDELRDEETIESGNSIKY
ncbi:hypothetical protein CDL12_02745 [Handroanthus impetiginosus]|uniref:Uncharacterized protein n=1 Tax=Handroanthus impetiginosus TaxID=429701 RepID=A0A2G9I430_9LAMI|nr:hypothetical protein CDL12_02745 [Handroanthus impetiginosus]